MKQTYNKIFELEQKVTLVVENDNLPIQITGTEGKTVTINLEIEAEQEINQEAFQEIIQISYNEDDGLINVTTDEDEFSEQAQKGNKIKNIKIKAEVPSETKLSIHGENSPIGISEITEDIDVYLENGPIALCGCSAKFVLKCDNSPAAIKSCTGTIDITTDNGPISIKNFEHGFVKIEADNSPIAINGCSADIEIQTENSPINLTDVTGNKMICTSECGMIKVLKSDFSEVVLQSENGSIYYEFEKIEEGKFRFVNENGRTTLVIPPDTPVSLKAINENGRTHMGLHGNYEKSIDDDLTILTMVKQSGKVNIEVVNENGSVILIEDPSQNTRQSHGKAYKDKYKHKYYHKCHSGQSKHSQGFDFGSIGEIIENAVSSIPEAFKKIDFKNKFKKVIQDISPKAGTTFQNTISEVMDEVKSAMNEVKTELKKAKNDFKTKAKAKQEKASAEFEKEMAKYHQEMKEYEEKMQKYQQEKEKFADEYASILKEAAEKGIANPELPEEPEKPEMPEKPELQKEYNIDIEANVENLIDEEAIEAKVTSAVKKAFKKPGEDKKDSAKEKMKILELLEKGVISVDDAERLIKAME